MPSIRKAVRDAIADVLSDPGNGFNPTFATLAPAYGVDPFTINWAPGSRNLFYGYLPPGQVNISSIADYPAFCIYTLSAENRHETKPRTFSGPVVAHVDAYLRFRTGAEQYDTESVCEAVEDAVITCLERDTAAWPPSVSFTGQYTSFWLPIDMLEDGWERVIPMELLFEVNV